MSVKMFEPDSKMKPTPNKPGKFEKLNGGKTTKPTVTLNLGCLQRYGNRKVPIYSSAASTGSRM